MTLLFVAVMLSLLLIFIVLEFDKREKKRNVQKKR